MVDRHKVLNNKFHRRIPTSPFLSLSLIVFVDKGRYDCPLSHHCILSPSIKNTPQLFCIFEPQQAWLVVCVFPVKTAAFGCTIPQGAHAPPVALFIALALGDQKVKQVLDDDHKSIEDLPHDFFGDDRQGVLIIGPVCRPVNMTGGSGPGIGMPQHVALRHDVSPVVGATDADLLRGRGDAAAGREQVAGIATAVVPVPGTLDDTVFEAKIFHERAHGTQHVREMANLLETFAFLVGVFVQQVPDPVLLVRERGEDLVDVLQFVEGVERPPVPHRFGEKGGTQFPAGGRVVQPRFETFPVDVPGHPG